MRDRSMRCALTCDLSPSPPAEEVSTGSDAGTLQWAQADRTLLSTLITCMQQVLCTELSCLCGLQCLSAAHSMLPNTKQSLTSPHSH